MTKTVFLFLFILLFSAGALAQNSTQSFRTDEGFDIEFRVRMEKEVIMLAETTHIIFEIKNHSSQELFTGVGGDYRNNIGRPDSYRVSVVREEDGKEVFQPKVTFWMGGFVGGAKIPAGGSYIRKLYLPHWAIFEKPGNYTITVRRKHSINNYKTDVSNSFAAEVSTKLKIIPTDKEKLGSVIDSLAETLFDESKLRLNWFSDDDFDAFDAILLLGFIDDPRIIKYLAQTVEKYGMMPQENEFSNWDETRISEKALWFLSKRPENEAFEAIKKAMHSPADGVRLAVADAFTESKNPEALKLLLKMRNDSYSMVRLRVVQGYGELKNDEAGNLLREFLDDEDRSVREAAQRYLDKRAQK